MGKTPLRRGFRSDASSFCTPERGRACLFQSIFCDFTRTSASGEPAMSHKTGWQEKTNGWRNTHIHFLKYKPPLRFARSDRSLATGGGPFCVERRNKWGR
jgi:hypothetical protein